MLLGRWWRGRRDGPQTPENLTGYARLQGCLAATRRAYCLGERVRADILEQVPRGASLNGPKHEFVIIEGRQHQDLDIGPPAFDARCRTDTIQARHAQIHEDDARLAFRGKFLRFRSVACLADDVHIVVEL